ncbi:hypothetical protein H0H81_002357 [Sphagnurus paluster]|uniref:RNA polymerase II elongation factor ELL N-terminal domain-containing protein n=1 Tax=Sphagnurus paluster TaxID=117069 RepID=A0A9P7K7P3_9AGAR|nr:hypothetical protein H0H81_002357 [Sphagnurus paluster]
MLVRLTSETLDALQALGEKPPLDFEFGETPGIHIGNTFYPMRPLREETAHELYLRLHSASKPNSSLKLYANVTGKFSIERDELGSDLKDRIREKTKDAAKQRDDRRTKFIEAPPKLAPPAKLKKRKDPPANSMFRNAIRPADQAKLSASSHPSAAPTRTTSPAPPSTLSQSRIASTSATPHTSSPAPPKKRPSNPALRHRLIHYIVIHETTRDELVKLAASDDHISAKRREVLDILEEVGEPTSPVKKGEDLGSKHWRLKTQFWTEVRPYEWPGISSEKQTSLARNGRMKLSDMGIKESDPLWKPFLFQTPAINASSASPSKANASRSIGEARQGHKGTVVPKRGVSSKEMKEKPRPKADPKAEIQMKDESVKARVTSTNGRGREAENALQSNQPTTGAVTRKLPGSGFRVKPTSSQDPRDEAEGSKRSGSLSVKASTSRSSLPTRPTPSFAQPCSKETITASASGQRIKRLRESDGVGSDSDRERGTDRSIKSKPQAKQHPGDERRKAEVSALKRKQAHLDDPEVRSSPQKKRKTEGGAALPSSGLKPKDLLLPAKPELVPPQPRTKVRKDLSPLPQPPPLPKINKKETPQPSSTFDDKYSPQGSIASTHSRGRSDSKASTSTRARRKSPVYTSSEDEGEIRRPRRETQASTALHARAPSVTQTRTRPREPRPLPTDHAGLRARYSATYNDYMAVFSRMVGERSKLDNMLRTRDNGSTTDSDGDIELMDADELTRLKGEYKSLHEELATIRGMFPEAD